MRNKIDSNYLAKLSTPYALSTLMFANFEPSPDHLLLCLSRIKYNGMTNLTIHIGDSSSPICISSRLGFSNEDIQYERAKGINQFFHLYDDVSKYNSELYKEREFFVEYLSQVAEGKENKIDYSIYYNRSLLCHFLFKEFIDRHFVDFEKLNLKSRLKMCSYCGKFFYRKIAPRNSKGRSFCNSNYCSKKYLQYGGKYQNELNSIQDYFQIVHGISFKELNMHFKIQSVLGALWTYEG